MSGQNLITEFKKLYEEGKDGDSFSTGIINYETCIAEKQTLTGKVVNAYKGIKIKYKVSGLDTNSYFIDGDYAVVIIRKDTFTFNAPGLEVKHITFYGDNCSYFKCNTITSEPSIIESMDFSNLPKLNKIYKKSFYNVEIEGNFNLKVPNQHFVNLRFKKIKNIDYNLACGRPYFYLVLPSLIYYVQI